LAQDRKGKIAKELKDEISSQTPLQQKLADLVKKIFQLLVQ
jgi:hypothetical protein